MLSHIQLFVTPRTVTHQAPLSMEFSRQEYWSGLPFPPPGDLPKSGIKPPSLVSPVLASRFFTTAPHGKPKYDISHKLLQLPFMSEWCFLGGASGKESTYQCTRCKRQEFDPWVRTIPWRRKWQPTPVFLPRKSHGQRSLVGYSP